MVKRTLKSLAKAAWKLTAPVRRPISRKFEITVFRIVSEVVGRHLQAALPPRFDALEHGLSLARHETHAQGLETNLALDSLVREVGRLQMQIEVLQQQLDDRRTGVEEEDLLLVGEERRARVG